MSFFPFSCKFCVTFINFELHTLLQIKKLMFDLKTFLFLTSYTFIAMFGCREVRMGVHPPGISNLFNSHSKIISLIFFPEYVWDKGIKLFPCYIPANVKYSCYNSRQNTKNETTIPTVFFMVPSAEEQTFNTKIEYCYLKHIDSQYKCGILKSCRFVNFLTPFGVTIVIFLN